jgi:PAS domain S-box-containing protein
MSGSGGSGGLIADLRDLRRVEHAVARILAETEGPVEAYEAILAAIGETIGWRLGAVWEVDPADGKMRCVRMWRSGPPAEEFERLSAELALGPGEGLPGRVLAAEQPAWMQDAPEGGNFPRAGAARRAGLHAAFAFPLRSPEGAVGIMEFFAGELREPDDRLLATMDVLGSQVGQFVRRRRAEDAVRLRESRLRAVLEAALDAVVMIDADGTVVGWNPAAERIFGYQAEEAMGREMADLIVPPELRDHHREGLARFVETGYGPILDRRVEITGMRRDGTTFPVELTITRVALPGPPAFTGYLRDITDRVRADRELRASRARLVEVADAERKRIQRNLHDGAQQRLTSALLCLGRLRSGMPEPQHMLDLAIDEIATGLDEIRELSRGLHPPILAERGLASALEALAHRTPLPIELEATADRTVPEAIEAAGYYVVVEGLANVGKHAGARHVVVRAVAGDGRLEVSVADDGVGGADVEGGGLRGLADRVEALGGSLTVESSDGGGTRLSARIPY